MYSKSIERLQFSIVTPEQSEHIKPVDIAILTMIPQGDPDLTAYLDELLRTNKPEQRNNTFCSQHLNVQEKQRITPQYSHESSKNYLNWKNKKNSINKRAQNLETKFSNDLIGLTHF